MDAIDRRKGMINALEYSLAEAKAGNLVDLFFVGLSWADKDLRTIEFSTYGTDNHDVLTEKVHDSLVERDEKVAIMDIG